MSISRLAGPVAVVLFFTGLSGCSELTVEFTRDYDKAPYLPSPITYVDKMLALAKAGPDDVIYDLGSGDGRIPIRAAERFGVKKGVGIEIDPALVKRSNDNARKAGVADRVRFVRGDVFKVDFREATVVTLYLLPSMNLQLRPRLYSELKPGTRIVAHRFGLGSWKPDRAILADDHPVVPVNYGDDDLVHLMLWIVPATAGGEWRLTAGTHDIRLSLKQDFQELSGTLTVGGYETGVTGRLAAERLRFESAGENGGRLQPVRFEGRLSDNGMRGTLTFDGRRFPATATRVR
jgi:SAM-dependent methyltransferase